MFFYLRQILLLLEVLLINKPSAKNMFVLLTSPLPISFLLSLPFAICIGISLGAIIIKDIKTQIIEKTRGSFVKIMLIGLILSLACIYISWYIIPDSNISFNNAYRSALLNDDDIIFERIANSPREMTMTQLLQEINLLKMEAQENNRLLFIYKYELQKNIAFSLSPLF
jgi:magnesium-transporting ATPase (P-type)